MSLCHLVCSHLVPSASRCRDPWPAQQHAGKGQLGHFLARTEAAVWEGEDLESKLSSLSSQSGDLTPHSNTFSGVSGKRDVAFCFSKESEPKSPRSEGTARVAFSLLVSVLTGQSPTPKALNPLPSHFAYMFMSVWKLFDCKHKQKQVTFHGSFMVLKITSTLLELSVTTLPQWDYCFLSPCKVGWMSKSHLCQATEQR